MKKEAKPTIVQPSEIILKDKVKKRQELRKEFLLKQKEKYKNQETNLKSKDRKKQIISDLKEVYSDAS